METDPSEPHRAAARTRLAHLSGLLSRADAADKKILAAALAHREKVSSAIDEARPKALVDDAEGDRYRDLIAERGQLDIVIARALAASA